MSFGKDGASSLNRLSHNPALSVFAYCLASISMTVINKYCVSGSKWNLNFFYLAVQTIVCIIAIQICQAMGWIKNLAGFDPAKARKWFPISMLLVGMIYTSTKALQFLSVPVYTIFKNLTIIAIAYGESVWFGATVTSMALSSFGLIVLSSVVAAWADIQIALNPNHHSSQDSSSASRLATAYAGYAWMGMNVVCTASYVLGKRKYIRKLQLGDWDTMFYDNLLTIPVLVLCTLLFEDWSSENVARNFPPEQRRTQFAAMAYSGLGTIFISYASAWCIRVTSSTTYSMVGALNKLPIALSGLIFFGTPATVGTMFSIFLGLVSGLVFTWAKVRQAEMNKAALPLHEPKSPRDLEKK